MKTVIGAILAAEVFLCAFSVSAHAKTMKFGESSVVGGDFANLEHISNTNLGSTPSDFIRVSGSLSGSCASEHSGFVRCSSPSSLISSDDSRDAFIFSIDDRHKVSKVTVSSKGTGPEGFTIGYAMTTYTKGRNAPNGWSTIIAGVNEKATWKHSAGTSFNPYAYDGANTFGFTIAGFTAAVGGAYDLDWDVKLEFAAISPSTVPIPASAPLLIAAMGGLAMLRRKRRALKAATKA